MHHVAQKLNDIRDELGAFYLEREEAIYAAVLALLAREHLFILGLPGTSKTQMIDEFVKAIVGARHFKAQLSKNRPAEAVLGPLDIKKFRENGDYFLKRAGFASAVELVTLDEIGKMSPVLGHDLLSLANEREYHEVNGGRSVHKAPLSSIFSMSNEMPTTESDDAAALWDRLLVRVVVEYLQDKANFARLLTAKGGSVTTTVDWDDLKKVIEDEIPTIPLSDDALQAIVKLRSTFASAHIVPSDRRWRASIRVLQAAAFLDGRSTVEEEDLGVLRFTLWDTVEQIDQVNRMCLSASNPFVQSLMELRDMLGEIRDGIEERATELSANPGDATVETQAMAFGKDSNKKLQSSRDRLDMMLLEANGRKIPGFKKVSDMHRDLFERVYVVCMQQDPEVAEITVSKKLGMGDGGNVR